MPQASAWGAVSTHRPEGWGAFVILSRKEKEPPPAAAKIRGRFFAALRMTDSSHIDAHLIALQAHGVGADGAHGGQGAHGARPYVEARAVARTLPLAAGERALAQRTAVVRAEVVDGEEVASGAGGTRDGTARGPQDSQADP